MVAFFRKESSSTGSLIESLRDGDYSPYLIIFSVIASILSLGVALSLSYSFHKIAAAPPPTLVQTENGAITVKEEEYLYRSPNNIRDFVTETLVVLLSWNGKTVDMYGNLKDDPGVKVEDNDPVPTRSYHAAHAFTTEGRLRSAIIERIAAWSNGKLAGGGLESRLEVLKVSIPKELEEPGHWSLTVVATRQVKKGQQQEFISFNKKLFVRAVPIVSNPVPEAATAEEKAYYKLRAHGLEIYRMQSINEG